MPPCSTSHQLSHRGSVTSSLQHRDPGETETRENTREAVKWTEHQQFKLLKVQEVPDHHKEISIFGGYRQRLEYKDCLWSIFRLHNETVNIWTHLIGFLIFFSLMVRDALWRQEHIRDVTDLAASLLQLVTYQACMLSSSMFHTMSCHDSRTTWQRIDHASILIALYGTYVRVIVNNFDCFPQHKAVHLVTVTALFGSVLYLKTKTSSGSRVSLPLFLFMALYSVAPFAHWVSLSHLQTNTNVTDTMLWWMVFPYLVAGAGVIFYISHFPEVSCCSGKFDIYGSSHQIWHVLIFSGMAAWYWLCCWVSTTRPLDCIMSELNINSNISLIQESNF